MLAEVKPDAVDVCLPNYEHLPAALDSIAAGCHVFMEKPRFISSASSTESRWPRWKREKSNFRR